MYHYIRSHREALPFFTYLHQDDFVKQLSYLKSEYGFANQERFLEWIRDPAQSNEPPGVVLTFDDGFREHFEIVAPILAEFGAWGIFYVPSLVLTSETVLDVHRAHLLLGHLSGETCLRHLLDESIASMFPDEVREDFRFETYVNYKSGDAATTQFKRMINFYVDYTWRKELLDKLISRFIPSSTWSAISANFYMNSEMVRQLHAQGHLIGSHSVTHRLMSKLSEDEQRIEIGESSTVIQEITGSFPLTFCYPYGGFPSFNATTEKVLEEVGLLFAFNVEERDISQHDVATRRFALPRYDCNSFPHGNVRVGDEYQALSAY